MLDRKAYMIIDMQFGSTGKGLLAGYLAEKRKPDTVVTAWGPNAGHTYIDRNGRKFVHRMLANGIVSPNLKRVMIGPGSVIDPEILMQEIIKCKDLLKDKHIFIHPCAAIVNSKHIEQEKSKNYKIGSTMKGTGAAVIQRLQRDPENLNIAHCKLPRYIVAQCAYMGIHVFLSPGRYQEAMESAELIQIEGAQGFSLSIYHGIYPYTTSRDVTPSQVMADCAIPFNYQPEIIGTLRTYPIRVANRFDEDGNMIGTSGPGYSDQKELLWDELGIEPELTTVTQLPRRIFSFSMKQLNRAVHICRPDSLFLNFCNYMNSPELDELQSKIKKISKGANIDYLGFGPNANDILELDICPF